MQLSEKSTIQIKIQPEQQQHSDEEIKRNNDGDSLMLGKR